MKAQNKTEIKRGDLYLYDFGNNEGSIQCGLRPVLVLQSDRFSRSPTVIIAAITSIIKKQYLPSHIIIESRFGLQQNSMVMLEQIRTVNKSELQRHIGFIDDETIWRKINNAIKRTFGLWFYSIERTGDIRCLCPKCISDYKSNSSFIIRRLDPFSNKVEKCEKCDGIGYDYLIYDKKVVV